MWLISWTEALLNYSPNTSEFIADTSKEERDKTKRDWTEFACGSTNVIHGIGDFERSTASIVAKNITPLVSRISKNSVSCIY